METIVGGIEMGLRVSRDVEAGTLGRVGLMIGLRFKLGLNPG